MSYVIKRVTSYPFAVDVDQPGNGPKQTQSLPITFKYLTRAELDALDATDPAGVLNQVLVGADVVDESGNALPFTDELKATLLQDPLTFYALYRAFWASTREAVAKN